MLPLRLVLDTNIIVSAALRPEGLPRTAFLLAITKPARMYLSAAILAEYQQVLTRTELQIRKGMRQQLLQLVKRNAHLISATRHLNVCGDPDDNKFLECADAARADYLMTGNPRYRQPAPLPNLLETDKND
jgi:uncharacterized protein